MTILDWDSLWELVWWAYPDAHEIAIQELSPGSAWVFIIDEYGLMLPLRANQGHDLHWTLSPIY